MPYLLNTQILQPSDVGNVSPVKEGTPGSGKSSQIPRGTPGLMNTGVVSYNRCNTLDGKPSDLDIGQWDKNRPHYPGSEAEARAGSGRLNAPTTFGIAGFMRVAPNTVRRWFGMEQRLPGGSTIPTYAANCVPISAYKKPNLNADPPFPGNRIAGLPEHGRLIGDDPQGFLPGQQIYIRGPQARAVFACALTLRVLNADGSIQRIKARAEGNKPSKAKQRAGPPLVQVEAGGLRRNPIFTMGDQYGNPYLHDRSHNLIGGAMSHLWQIYTGGLDGSDNLMQQGWVQMCIIPPSGLDPYWHSQVLHFYPGYEDKTDYEEEGEEVDDAVEVDE